MSEIVSCPEGTDQFSIMYWLSPWVKVEVCLKSSDHPFPNYDFCSVLPGEGSPGPVNIVLPSMGNVTFQVGLLEIQFNY